MSHMCVDLSCLPSGRLIVSGFNAGAYNRRIKVFFGCFFLADLSYVGFVLVGDFLDIQR